MRPDRAPGSGGLFGGPLWVSGFRPFYLLGALYAPLLALGGAGAYLGWVDLQAVGGRAPWHGHEMLFGFASAIVIGTLLTALPSWAGMPELQGTRLALLVALWLLGRVAAWSMPWLPPALVALCDLLLWPAFGLLIGRALWRVPDRRYRLLLPIVLAMALANLAHHAALIAGQPLRADRALRAATWTLMVLFTLKGGLLTPVFTGNALRALGRGDVPPWRMPLEVLALLLLVALAVADVAAGPRPLTALLAAACTLVHGVRVARWQGWRVADQPLLPSMHLGFAWLLAALALKTLADATGLLPEPAWLHAFTVGALGLMMLGLMTRVSLRHTGHALHAPTPMRVAAVLLFGAAGLRLAVTLLGLGPVALALAVTLWAAAFGLYLLRFTAVLLAPSLPRSAADAAG